MAPPKFESSIEILEPGRYWIVMPENSYGPTWDLYRDVLKLRDPGAFQTIETWQNKREQETWAVIEVKEPITIDATGYVQFGPYQSGDDPQKLGLWETPREHWIVTASEAVDTVKKGVSFGTNLLWLIGGAWLASKLLGGKGR